MHQSVIDAFPAHATSFEGRVPSMYCDVLGLITVGIGCLADPVQLAIPMPWKHGATGQPATANEVATAWRALKAQKDKYAKLHWKYAAALNDLRLDDTAIDDLMRQRLLANEKVLRSYFPNWDAFPADAQLCCCSMGWAMGPGFPHTFGNFKDAANAQNWISAMAACGMRTDGNPGVVPRNAADKLCCANAASVIAQGLPLDVLYWPGTAPSASQRDDALRAEADFALKSHVQAMTDAATTHDPSDDVSSPSVVS